MANAFLGPYIASLMVIILPLIFYKVKSLPLQLVAVIGLVLLAGDYVSPYFVQLFYTFSLCFKEVLSFILPFIIFSFVMTGILSFKKNAPLILLVLASCIFLSNGIIAMMTYLLARLVVPLLTDGLTMQGLTLGAAVEPLYQVSFPALIRSEYALIAAVILGLGFSFVRVPQVEDAISWFKQLVERFLNKVFIPFLPLYVFGFLLEMNSKGVFGTIFSHYGKTFLVIFLMQMLLLSAYYLCAAGGNMQRMFAYVRNALPSYITAFSTMSSTATIPVTIESAEKNIGNKPLAELAMPIMANIHLTGDSISTPLLAMVSTLLFLGSFPSLMAYATFVVYFCVSMLAVSGIPGGGIIVMIPVLISQFGFTQEMVSIITALYLLLDPFGTAANVMGDGALVIMVNKLLKKLRIIS